MFSLIIDYWMDNGIYSALIMIIINLIIDKSRLCYKITIKYWQNVPYSQLYSNKTQIKTSTKKIRIFYASRFFSGQNRKKSAHITRANTVLILILKHRLCVGTGVSEEPAISMME